MAAQRRKVHHEDGFRADGHLCCRSWLRDKCGLGWSTAKEKLRIAYQLTRLDTRIDREYRQAGDKASAEASANDTVSPLGLSQRRYDALVDQLECGAARSDDGILDAERAQIGVTVSYETLIERFPRWLISIRAPSITGEAVRRLCCDVGLSRLVTRGRSEILDAGRKTRQWSRAQRRAIRARHVHQCAVRGCGGAGDESQIHHVDWWEQGDVTSVDNGLPLCLGHHHLVHEGGWTVRHDITTGVTTLTGPDRQQLRTYRPVNAFAA